MEIGTRPGRRGMGVTIVLCMIAALLTLGSGSASAAGGHRKPADSDRDGIPNTWEKNHGLRMHFKDAQRDPDHDGLINLGEFRNSTRPHSGDTDHDGLDDGDEVHGFDTDPTEEDSDDDGIDDGDDDGDGDGVCDEGEDGDGKGFVGTIISFTPKNGLLLFESSVGWPIVGVVNADTELSFGGDCEGPATTADLLEGFDIAEVQFYPFDPSDEFPVFKSITLSCPKDGG